MVLISDGESSSDNLSGWAVSINSDGGGSAIGVSLKMMEMVVDAGHVRVFEWNGTSWTQLGQDIDGGQIQ